VTDPSRRTALKAFVGLGLATTLDGCAPALDPVPPVGPGGGGRGGEADDSGAAGADSAPRAGQGPAATPATHGHPARGDRLTFAFGEREGGIVAPADVPVGGPPVFAYPADSDGGHVANGRLDQVLLVRVDPATLDGDTRARSAEGIVAYSGICTHNGSEVSDWDSGRGLLLCPCHDSSFDPKDAGSVVEGPAPSRLAALPVEIVGGELFVAGGFAGRVGFQRR
jgi:Rieske Fe-S protein